MNIENPMVVGAEAKEPDVYTWCAVCEEPIYMHEDVYNFYGEKIHEDCLIDYAEQFREKAEFRD